MQNEEIVHIDKSRYAQKAQQIDSPGSGPHYNSANVILKIFF